MGLDFFTNALPLEKAFWLCAIASTLFFFLRVIMMVIGADADHDVLDGDLDADHGSDDAFQVLSINSITAFFMMFGWIGLACYKQFDLGSFYSITLAIIAGVLCLYLTAYLFKSAKKFMSRGGDFNIDQTIGLVASVYQEIPEDGIGKVNLSMPGGMLREFNAKSVDGAKIESFKTVRVVKVVNNYTVLVEKM